MTLRSNWMMATSIVGLISAGCAQEPPRRPLEYGTSGNRPPQVLVTREPLYTPSLGTGTISGSAGSSTRPASLTGAAQPSSMPTGAELPMSPSVGASGAPVTPGTPGPAAPGTGDVAVPPPADVKATTPPAAPASNP